MNKIKVLNVIANMDDGGAQKIVLNYMNGLNNDEDIDFSTLVLAKKTNSFCNRIIEQKNYNVHYLNVGMFNIKIPIISKVLKIIKTQKEIIKKLNTIKPDIVHLHAPVSLVYLLYPVIKCKIPIRMTTFHSNPYRDKGLKYLIIKKALKKYDFIPIFITKEQKEMANKYYNFSNGEILYNGIDIRKIKKQIVSKNEARRKFNIDNDKYVICAVGRLNKIKNFNFLIEIFNKIQNKNSLLVIAGDGEEKENLLNLCKSYKIKDRVIFLGNIDNVTDLYCASDVFVMTSISEASPLVLLEAQICDKYCVISNGVPSESIVTNKVNKLKKNASISEWVNAIEKKDYYGDKIIDISNYDLNNSINNVKKLYMKYFFKNR